MTRVKQFIGLAAIVGILAVLANAGVFGGNAPQKRDCGKGVRVRTVVATASWAPRSGQQRSFVQISGFIGPTVIEEPNISTPPQRFPAGGCPGDTAAIMVEAHSGPLPDLWCMISVDGVVLSGDAVQKTGTPGYRAKCQAVIK